MDEVEKYERNFNYMKKMEQLSNIIFNTLSDVTPFTDLEEFNKKHLNNLSNLDQSSKSESEDDKLKKILEFKNNKLKEARCDYNKKKLKHNILKNISYYNDDKSITYALYYFNNIKKNKFDKIGYYIDFKKDYNIIKNIYECELFDKNSMNFINQLNSNLDDKDIEKKIIREAENVYLGPRIFLKYHFIDIMVISCILITILFILSIKTYVSVYKTGIILLILTIILVCITTFFYNLN